MLHELSFVSGNSCFSNNVGHILTLEIVLRILSKL